MRGKRLALTAFLIYFILLVWLVIFKLNFNITDAYRYRDLILIPFYRPGVINMRTVLEEIVWNVIAFVPMGLLLSALGWPKRAWARVLTGFVMSLVFETAQYVFAIGTTDVTDLINNTLGTLIGVLLFALLKKLLKEKATLVTGIAMLVLEGIAFGGYAFLWFVNI